MPRIASLIALFVLSQPVLTQTMNQTEAEKWRADLRFMVAEMPKYHKNLFHTMTREQFEIAVNRLYERIPSLARHQVIVELARIVAMVGDGHTNIAPTRDVKIGFRTLPLKLYLFKEGLICACHCARARKPGRNSRSKNRQRVR